MVSGGVNQRASTVAGRMRAVRASNVSTTRADAIANPRPPAANNVVMSPALKQNISNTSGIVVTLAEGSPETSNFFCFFWEGIPFFSK